MAFIHLHNHTEYSLLDGATKVKAMVKKAIEFGMDAIAITDHGYMYGVPAFVAACNENGVKPIIGCEIYLTSDSELRRDRKPDLYHMILLAKNQEGYANLVKICSESATENFYYKPRVPLELLQKYAGGLIATSACVAGIIPQMLLAGREEDALNWGMTLRDTYAPGDFYIELQNQELIFRSDERGAQTIATLTQNELNHKLASLAKELQVRTTAANDMHYLRREDAVTQDIMLCIGTGKRFDDVDRMRFENDQFYMKSEEEMRLALSDFPEACDATAEIAEKCNVTIDESSTVKRALGCGVRLSHEKILPLPQMPEETNEDELLYTRSMEGLLRLYGNPLPKEVEERFNYEYSIIVQQGFPAYFLVVQEFVSWAKANGVWVGPGRGSAAGSIISYALGITGLDPLANELLFERFMSLERVEMPDIDIDFDDDGRAVVIEHLRELYGADKVAHVITYSSLKAKQAVVDATRVFDYPIYLGAQISKMIQFGPDASLLATLGKHKDAEKNNKQRNAELIERYEKDPDVKKIVDAAISLEGTVRGEGIHASAVIISPLPVRDLVPTKLDTKGGMLITQFDGTHNAKLGLLKMDFLGLRTLNVLMKAQEYVERNHDLHVKMEDISLEDPKVFEMLRRGDTAGVFQVESPGMTALIRSMRVDRYSDIVAAIALFRPGPLGSGMVDDFVGRKTGKRKVVYYDNRLEPILKETYGTLVYQEQVMRISMAMSGFTAGESDVIRKAVAKKNIELMKETVRTWADGVSETMEEHWICGAERNGYPRETAQTIWDDVEKFAQYAFNKSHSAAYAVLVMQTAWFKAYYPIEYMAAVLSSFVGKADRLTGYIAATRQMGIAVLPPDVNSSGREFTPTSEGIRFGLAGIRGVGTSAADAIIAERESAGPYTSLHDFVFRISNTYCNKGAVEAMIKAGALDSTGYTRQQMMRFLEIDQIMVTAAKRHRDKADGQVSLFELFDSDDETSMVGFEDKIPEPDGVEWERRQLLEYEREILKMYVSGHPLDSYAAILKANSDYSLAAFAENSDDEQESAIDDDANAGMGMATGTDIDERYQLPPEKVSIKLAGMITKLVSRKTAKGDTMATFVLEDTEGSVEAVVFPSYYEKFRQVLTDDGIVQVVCRHDRTDRGSQVLVNAIKLLSNRDGGAAAFAGAGSRGDGAAGGRGDGAAGGGHGSGAAAGGRGSSAAAFAGDGSASSKPDAPASAPASAQASMQDSEPTVTQPLSQESPRVATITVAAHDFNQVTSDSLMRLLRENPGKNPVVLRITQSNSDCNYQSELPLCIDATAVRLQDELAALLGAGCIRI